MQLRLPPVATTRPKIPRPTGAKSDVDLFAAPEFVLLVVATLALGVLLSGRGAPSLFVDATRGTWLGRCGLNGGGFRFEAG